MMSGEPGTERGTAEQVALDASLTPRETEVFVLAARGLSYAEIAARLSVTKACVQSLISKGRRKMLAEFHRRANFEDVLERLGEPEPEEELRSFHTLQRDVRPSGGRFLP